MRIPNSTQKLLFNNSLQHKHILFIGDYSESLYTAARSAGAVCLFLCERTISQSKINHIQREPLLNAPVVGYINATPLHVYDHIVVSSELSYSFELVSRILKFNGVYYHKDKVKIKQPGFILATYPRCGTHMLATALDTHTELSVYGEVANIKTNNGKHGFPNSAHLLEGFWKTAHTGVAIHSYIGQGHNKTGLSAAHSNYRKVWKHLPDNTKIIKLQRRDLLARYVSHKLAKQTNTWNKYKHSQKLDSIRKLNVNFKQLYTDATYVKKCWQYIDTLFPQNHTVYYEELINDWDNQIKHIQNYLGVKPRQLTTSALKLTSGTVADRVTNYDALLKIIKQKNLINYLGIT